VAIELKSIFTEHGKARRNRLRDFSAFHNYAHSYGPKTIAWAFLLINAAEKRFECCDSIACCWSHLRFA